MKRCFRWTFWRWRYHYWRRRAVLAERQLAAEVDRNRAREDTLVTVPMRLGGLWGMPAREGAAIKQVGPPRPALTQSADPWESLSWADKQEYEMMWKPDAEAAGLSEVQARQDFLMKVILPRRQSINDDPFAN